MSLVNPESRWYNRGKSRRAMAYILWAASLALGFCGTAEMFTAGHTVEGPGAWPMIAVSVSLFILIGAGFLHQFGSEK